MFRSATFKLTIWYLAIVMAISLVFSVVLYNVATHELVRGLHRETQRIFNQYPVFQGVPGLAGPGPDAADAAHRILLKLVAFNVLVLVGAGFASYWLARRTLEPIEEAHEQQKRFTADVSHELRTPLTALKMESEVALLNKSSTAAELRSTLSSNLEEVVKIESLINNLLRLTRLEADEIQHQFSPVDMADVVSTAVKQSKAVADGAGVKLIRKTVAGPVLGDQESLTQLVVILLDNAIKYSPKGQTVTISTEVVDGQVVTRVVDQGVGIKEEALEQVFNRFYRADSSRGKTSTSGYGLGLSIAKMIGDVHGATITLASQEGKGTTASVKLPQAPEPQAL